MQNSTTVNSQEMTNNQKELVVFDRARFLMTPIWENLFGSFTKDMGYTLRYVTQDPQKVYEESLCEEMAKEDPPVLLKIHGDVLRKFDFVQDTCESLDDTRAAGDVGASPFVVRSHDGRVIGLTYYLETIGFLYNKKIIQKYFALTDRQQEIHSVDDLDTQDKMEFFVKDLDAHKAELGIDAVFPAYCFAPGSEGMSYPMTPPLYMEAHDKGVTRLESFDFTYSDYLKRFFDMVFQYAAAPPEEFEKTDLLTHIGQFVTGRTAMLFGADAIQEVYVRRMEKTAPEKVKDLLTNDDIGLIPPYYKKLDADTCPFYMGTAWMFAVNRNASEEKKRIAKEFIDWMVFSANGKKVIKNMGYVLPFLSVKEEEIPQNGINLYKYQLLRKNYKVFSDFGHTLMPVGAFRPNFFKNLNRYAKGEITWEQVVREAIDTWTPSYEKNRKDMQQYYAMLNND